MKRKLIIMLLIAILGICSTNAQAWILPRGPSPGEFYYFNGWFYTYADDVQTWMIIYTDDYGKSFQQRYIYELDFNNETYPMEIVFLHADATPGVLYNHRKYTDYDDVDLLGLYRSFDDGESWELVDPQIGETIRYSTGEIEGEIYKYSSSNGFLYSNNYGNDFILKNDTIFGFPEVGQIPGTIYMLSGSTYPTHRSILHYSSNYGESFLTNEVDSIIIGQTFSGHFPFITRGAIPGELYLISWWLEPDRFKIFRSTDHGQSFQLQFEMPESWDIYNYGYNFSAGRDEGEFYIAQSANVFAGNVGYLRLHMHYSDDYAQSFKEYVHDFDKNWTENTRTIYAISHPEEWGTVSGAANYTLGETATLTATPNEGYEFKEWTEHGETVSDDAVYSFEVTETRNLVANFQLVNTISIPQSTVEINIYPNPATGQAILSIPNVSSFKNSTIHIINLYGQTVKTMPIKEKQTQIDLPAGSYLYRFTDGRHQLKTGKLIIN
jgi:hypothetical protein